MRKLVSLGKAVDEVIAEINTLELDVVEDMGVEHARDIARMAPEARRLGLSLGDCVCLVAAQTISPPSMPAGRERK